MVRPMTAYMADDGKKFFTLQEAVMHDHFVEFKDWYNKVQDEIDVNAIGKSGSAFPACTSADSYKWLVIHREYLWTLLNNIREEAGE